MASVVDKLISCVSASIDDASQRLQLNHDKTTSRRRQHLLPTRTIRVCDLEVSPTRAVRDLTVYIDADLSMSTHVTTTTVSECFAALRQIRSVRHSLSKRALLSVVQWSARLTNVTRFWPEYTEISWAGYSPSWTPPHVSNSRRGDHTTSRRYYANCIGWMSRRGSSFDLAWWLTDACATLHRHTSPTNVALIDWLSMVLRLHQHNIGYTADGLYRSDDPTNSVKALKEGG